MNHDALRLHCLSLPGVTEDFPFDAETLAFRVEGKIFLLTNVDQRPLRFNAKCDPARAIELRDQYPAIQPGYHMNKSHWNTVTVDGSLPAALVRSLVVDSWRLIVGGLPKGRRQPLLDALGTEG